MDFDLHDLCKKVNEVHPIALEEWVECFDEEEGDDEDKDEEHKIINAARREISKTLTLTNRDTWKDRNINFLLRLISDDHNGYRNWIDDEDEDKTVKTGSIFKPCHPEKVRSEPRPRVELALTFVEQMDKENPRVIEFLQETLSAHEREAVWTSSVLSVEDENASESARLTMDQTVDGGNETEMKQVTWKRGNGLIHEAAKSGRCAIFNKLGLILTKENVDYLNNIDESALHLAAEFEHVDDVRILLGARAEFKKDNDGCTPLHSAAMAVNPSEKIAELLLGAIKNNRTLLNTKNKNGNTALHIAAGNVNVRRSFIEKLKSANARLQNSNGDTPFHVAAKSTNRKTIIYMLKTFAPSRGGWDIDDADRHRKNKPTLLSICACNGNAKAVALLIQHGADLSRDILRDIVFKSVECPERTEQLLAVYRVIVDNAVTWRCLEDNMKLITKGSSQYDKCLRKTMMWLITRPDKPAWNVIICAIQTGASGILEEILNTRGVLRFDSAEKRETWYDVTNFTPDSKGIVAKTSDDDRTPATGTQSKRRYFKQYPQKLRDSYMWHLSKSSAKWREKKIFEKEPINGLTELYIGFSQKYYRLIALLHLLYMICFSYYYIPTTCSLIQTFNLNASASSCRSVAGNMIDAQSLVTSNFLWLLWPAILLVADTLGGPVPLNILASVIFFVFNTIYRRFLDKEYKWSESLTSISQQITTIAFCISIFIWYQYGDSNHHLCINATSMVLLFGWIADFFFFSQTMMKLSLFSQVLREIIVKDIVMSFLLVFLFTFVGFSFAMHTLRMSELPSDDMVHVGATAYDVFIAALGTGDYFHEARNERSRAGLHFDFFDVVVIAYLCVTAIILLNMLIALINHRYDKAMQRAKNVWRFQMLTLALTLKFLQPLFVKKPRTDPDKPNEQGYYCCCCGIRCCFCKQEQLQEGSGDSMSIPIPRDRLVLKVKWPK